MNYLLPIVLSFSLLAWLPPSSAQADEPLNFRDQLEKANDLIKSYRHFEACDALQEATKMAGDKHPSLHMRLAILYYGLGLIPEAIAEGEKAVSLSPSSKWYKYDLAKFYYVDKQHLKAEQQFVSLLTQDPGFTLGYYYLAELYFRNKNYDMAWLSLQRARLLGHRGKLLEEKLNRHSRKPMEDFSAFSPETMLFRYIKVGSLEEAKEILADVLKGKLFENVELELKKDKAGEIDFGLMDSREAAGALAEALRGQKLFADPTIVPIGSEYRIIQRIAPFNPEVWRAAIAASPSQRGKNPQPLAPAKLPSPSSDSKDSASVSSPMSRPSPATPIPSRLSREQGQLGLQLKAYYTLEDWKNAWQAADVENYLAVYSERFIPAEKVPLTIWKDKRRASLAKPRYIRLKIDNPIIEMISDDRLQITFTQHYASDNYSDSVRKALIMEREKETWKITEERTLAVLEP